MFCSQCGTQLPDDSAFCQNCGSPTDTPAGTASGPAGSTAAAPAFAGTDALGTSAGIGAFAGAGLAILGSLLSWVDFGPTINGFDIGYVTSPENGDGSDGLLIVMGSVIAAAIAIHYFLTRSTPASVAVLAAGAVVTVVGVYNLGRIVEELADFVSFGDAWGFTGAGIYLVIAGGLIITIAGIVGCFRPATPPSQPLEGQ